MTDEEKKKIAKGEKLFKELLMNQFDERIIDRRIEILKENNDLEYVLAFLKNKTRNLVMLSREEFLEKIGSLRNHGDRITYYLAFAGFPVKDLINIKTKDLKDNKFYFDGRSYVIPEDVTDLIRESIPEGQEYMLVNTSGEHYVFPTFRSHLSILTKRVGFSLKAAYFLGVFSAVNPDSKMVKINPQIKKIILNRPLIHRADEINELTFKARVSNLKKKYNYWYTYKYLLNLGLANIEEK